MLEEQNNQNNQNNQQGYIATPGNINLAGELEQLSHRFAEFRREHQPRARIPDELREASLEAIGKGIPDKSVREACRITSEQLNRWREVQWVRGRKRRGNKTKPRVFKVVDSPLEKKVVNNRQETPSVPVHLRIGGWEISIRPVEK